MLISSRAGKANSCAGVELRFQDVFRGNLQPWHFYEAVFFSEQPSNIMLQEVRILADDIAL